MLPIRTDNRTSSGFTNFMRQLPYFRKARNSKDDPREVLTPSQESSCERTSAKYIALSEDRDRRQSPRMVVRPGPGGSSADKSDIVPGQRCAQLGDATPIGLPYGQARLRSAEPLGRAYERGDLVTPFEGLVDLRPARAAGRPERELSRRAMS
jgi:hypothetical protein